MGAGNYVFFNGSMLSLQIYQSRALINLQQREISHLHLRKKSCTVYLKTETVEPGLMRTRKGHATVYILSGCPYQAGSQEKNVKTHVYRYKD